MKIKTIGKSINYVLIILCSLMAVANVFSQTEVNRKPSIAVVEFDVRNARVSWDVGRELSDMLVNALVESGRFRVVERTNLSPAQKEQFMALNGSVDPGSGAAVGKLIGAQYLVLSSVREFRQKETGFGPLRIPILGGFKTYQGIVKFNLRVVDSTTGEIVFSKLIEKNPTSAGIGDGTLYGVQLTNDYRSTAMQTAVQGAMSDTVEAISQRVSKIEPLPNTVVTEAKAASTAGCSAIIGAKAPRIMVVIPEIHITRVIPDPAGETEIIKKLVERGFNVVDQQQIAAIRNREKVLAAVKNPAAAAALGVEFNADIIIIGEAFSELADRSEKMISTRARVEARAIQTNNARILAADGKFGSGLDIAEFVSAKTALRNAGSQWADYFITQICRASPTIATVSLPKSEPVLSSGVEIMISGITFNQLRTFADRLAKTPGVQGVERTLTGDVGRLNIQYDGGGDKLADAISVTKFGLLRVNIVGLSGNKIEIRVGK